MAMDKSVLQSFLSERAGEVKHASSIITDAIFDDDEDGKKISTNLSKSKPKGAEEPGGVGPKPWDAEPNGEPVPRKFLSKRARDAIDDVVSDPDLDELVGRARSFAKGRLLEAEEAARILKGEEQQAGGGSGVGDTAEGSGIRPIDGEKQPRREGAVGAEGGSSGSVRGGVSETPIISGLASDARDFVSGRVGEAREAARVVVDAAMDVRRSRQAAKKATVDSEQDAARGEGAGGAVGQGREERYVRPSGAKDEKEGDGNK